MSVCVRGAIVRGDHSPVVYAISRPSHISPPLRPSQSILVCDSCDSRIASSNIISILNSFIYRACCEPLSFIRHLCGVEAPASPPKLPAPRSPIPRRPSGRAGRPTGRTGTGTTTGPPGPVPVPAVSVVRRGAASLRLLVFFPRVVIRESIQAIHKQIS